MMDTDPFADLIVKDPRSEEGSVPGLNEQPLQHLLARFDHLLASAKTRAPQFGERAILVVSEQPGYGKSHLAGRLFRALHGRATLVYVQPFQNPATAFHSLMLAVARELHFPDRATLGAWDPAEPTQLDQLAHAVLANLLADLVEGTSRRLAVQTPAETAAFLRKEPLDSFRRGEDPWAVWISENWKTLEPYFEEALARRGLTLAQPGTWLRVLRCYAFSPQNLAARRACIDWLAGQPFDREDVEQFGLRPGDATTNEVAPREANALCRTRLMELCQLAAFHRPIVFTFDQTEVYGHHPGLARAFGMVVATLVHEAPGTLLLVTANQSPWTQKVAPYIEDADLQRFVLPPLMLQGLNRAQAEELVKLRFRAAKVTEDRARAFLSPAWLKELFPTPFNQMGARMFLQRCQQRWANTPARTASLEQLYEEHREALLASPKRLGFHPDALQWLVESAAAGLPGVHVISLEERYFAVQWTTAERICLFGFIAGANWKQWRTLARISVERNRVGDVPTKCVFFRAESDAPVPGENWSVRGEIESAKRDTLHLVSLRDEDFAELYAGRELYADAVQGDIPYAADEVTDYLQLRLARWWVRLRGPVPAAEELALAV